MVPYLKKFLRFWPAGRFAKTYWDNKRARIRAMGNPNSSQFQKALKTSPKFAAQYEDRKAAGVFDNGPLGMLNLLSSSKSNTVISLVTRKTNNPHYSRGNKYTREDAITDRATGDNGVEVGDNGGPDKGDFSALDLTTLTLSSATASRPKAKKDSTSARTARPIQTAATIAASKLSKAKKTGGGDSMVVKTKVVDIDQTDSYEHEELVDGYKEGAAKESEEESESEEELILPDGSGSSSEDDEEESSDESEDDE